MSCVCSALLAHWSVVVTAMKICNCSAALELQVFPGQNFFVIDGQAGNDSLAVRAFLPQRPENGSNDPFAGLPGWMVATNAVTLPSRTLLPSSVALIGGAGDDSLTLEGNQRLYGLGGDGNDTIRLLSGHRGTLAGGAGNDRLILSGDGIDNLAFGDEGNDTIDVEGSLRATVFGEAGDDIITTTFSTQASARGGTGRDV